MCHYDWEEGQPKPFMLLRVAKKKITLNERLETKAIKLVVFLPWPRISRWEVAKTSKCPEISDTWLWSCKMRLLAFYHGKLLQTHHLGNASYLYIQVMISMTFSKHIGCCSHVEPPTKRSCFQLGNKTAIVCFFPLKPTRIHLYLLKWTLKMMVWTCLRTTLCFNYRGEDHVQPLVSEEKVSRWPWHGVCCRGWKTKTRFKGMK